MVLCNLSLLILSLSCLAGDSSTFLPRMVFKDKEVEVRRLNLPDHHAPVRILLDGEEDTVTTVGQKHLISFNFNNPPATPVTRTVSWEQCNNEPQRDCNYNITVVHTREESNSTFVCGTGNKKTVCCDVILSEQSPTCSPSKKIRDIQESIGNFAIKEGEPSVFVESEGGADLYITYSGSGEYVGIQRFGSKRVGPPNKLKEQHYVGLMLSEQDDSLQNKVYAFYKEKNGDRGMYSEMWLPFVSQVCTADVGGPKNTLQFTWTSQMNARLFCGHPDSKQHFSQLIDVAIVHEVRWQDTKVYALFRNEWDMSAVCVYSIEDISNVFQTSRFKGAQEKEDRPRKCVPDSKAISLGTLKIIERTSEMEDWVRPVNKTGPLLFNHHIYTHIYIDSSQDRKKNKHPVLFLTLNNGGIHKVVKSESHGLVIAEFQPLSHTSHVRSIILNPSSKKLYVSSESELVQMNAANCAQYGDSCESCILARDPYCSWKNQRCTPDENGKMQDVATGDYTICDSTSAQVSKYSTDTHADKKVESIRLPSQSKYFLQCPVSSHHAQYTWRHPEHHPEGFTSCSSREQQCLLLINSMGPEQVGTYTCESKEMGYKRVLAQHKLEMESRAAGHSSSLLVWVCLMAVFIKNLSC